MQNLDSGLDWTHGLDSGLDHGLRFGLDCGLMHSSMTTISNHKVPCRPCRHLVRARQKARDLTELEALASLSSSRAKARLYKVLLLRHSY